MQKNLHINEDKVFFLTGGGTGGHIYPCVSILNELKNKGFNNIYYVGNSKNPEFNIASPLCKGFLDVPVFGMPRKISLKLLRWCFLLFVSVLKCLKYAFEYKPSVVFATGGYVSAPMVIAANILKIPYVMHDSDAHPGIVTRAFAPGAKALNLAFREGNKYVKTKVITNFKNPIRNEFFTVSPADARKEFNLEDEFCILIMGGSQGAKTINNAAIGLVKYFKNCKNIKIIFQTGKKNYEDVIGQVCSCNSNSGEPVKVPENAIIRPYFEKMYMPILAADIIVSRAGSLSISEILAAKKPSILVPYPYAAADHQRKNAREIERLGAALYVEDKDLTSEILTEIINELIKTPQRLETLKENAEGEISENPTYKILELILDAAGAGA